MDDFFAIALFCLVIMITFFKKRGEVGKMWDRPVSAVVQIEGKELQCSHCGHNQFSKREGILVTKWVSLMGLSFWNRSARCFSCQNCGFLHWFVRTEEQADRTS